VRTLRQGGAAARAPFKRAARPRELVGVDWSDNQADAARFVRAHHWTFHVLVDSSGEVGNAYGLSGLPTTYLLDRQGRIVRRLIGPQTAAGLLSIIPR
jgi:peroxiredoxin